jgi:hypothetical protein
MSTRQRRSCPAAVGCTGTSWDALGVKYWQAYRVLVPRWGRQEQGPLREGVSAEARS